MWTRKELKDKAKGALKVNYWKSVLVALILTTLLGGASGFSAISGGISSLPVSRTETTSQYDGDVNVEIEDGKIVVDVDGNDGKVHVNLDSDEIEDLGSTIKEVAQEERVSTLNVLTGAGAALFGVTMLMVLLVVIAISIAVCVFVIYPLEIGCKRFFLRDLNQRSEVKEIAYAYDNNYLESVKTLFLRDLFIFLWSLLLIVPGIYKAYEYRMIPYLFTEDPTMTKDRAFAESKQMMDGQKWNAFVLDLSFLGWNILSGLTLGILGVFYVGPYQEHTNAALYEKLRYGLPAPEQPLQGYPYSYPYAPQSGTNAQAQAMPVYAPTSQPPIPPFAAVQADAPMWSDQIATSGMDFAEAPAEQVIIDESAVQMPEAEPMDGKESATQASTAELVNTDDGISLAPADDGEAENDAAPDSPEA